MPEHYARDSISGGNVLSSFVNYLKRFNLAVALDTPVILTALGKFKDSQSVQPLIEYMLTRRSSTAATVLGNIGDVRAVPPLIKCLEDKNSSLRYYAAHALGKLGDISALPSLEFMAQNDSGTNGGGESNAKKAAKAIEKIKEKNK